MNTNVVMERIKFGNDRLRYHVIYEQTKMPILSISFSFFFFFFFFFFLSFSKSIDHEIIVRYFE